MVIIYLIRKSLFGFSDLTRNIRRTADGDKLRFCQVLLRMGFTQPAYYYTAGELLPHRFTLTYINRRFTFCCTCLRVASTRCYLAFCPVQPGLSSLYAKLTYTAITRPAVYYNIIQLFFCQVFWQSFLSSVFLS